MFGIGAYKQRMVEEARALPGRDTLMPVRGPHHVHGRPILGRFEGLQTVREFTERRLAPAMNTCLAMAQRQVMLSQRVARATQLLSTRVDLTRERQNQALLTSMDRRAKLQLRLQQTVEGLSVAAITYYVVGLIAYAAKAIVDTRLPLRDEVVTGVAVPVVAAAVFFATRRVRRRMEREEP